MDKILRKRVNQRYYYLCGTYLVDSGIWRLEWSIERDAAMTFSDAEITRYVFTKQAIRKGAEAIDFQTKFAHHVRFW